MSERKITVNLYCPTLSTTAHLVAREDQLLDLGSISRTFRLDPATIKLNGHFICRGIDLIASSVTWKSLISFFSSRGFSTGICSSGAIIVDGNILKSGCKRAYDSTNGILSNNRKLQLEELNSSKKTKFEDLDVKTKNRKPFISNVYGIKRKQEVANPSLKRCKVDESEPLRKQSKMSERKRTVNLYCPVLSTTAQLVACDDQLLDLGSISRTFGLEPATIKLNGHFICRGIDLIASSVTWKSLISFFSSRGFPIGIRGFGAIIVNGKILKSGCKRAYDSTHGIFSNNRKLQLEELNLSKKTKFEDLEVNTDNGKPFISNLLGIKRKQEVANPSLKRCKVDGSGSQIREHADSETLLKTQLPCGFLGVKRKRVREDDMILP